MIDAAETTYLVADSTKMGKALLQVWALSLIDSIITDSGIEEKHKKLFKDNEIELIIAS
jgi:DeoR/GlpR family transcriptional regulator of sugar metabolism